MVLLDLDADAAKEVATSLGDRSLALHCDVADESSVQAAFDVVRNEFGTLDVLHSNAGVFFGHGNGNDGPLDTLDLATWRRTLDVNLTGGFLCSKYAMPLLLDGGGSITFTASVSGALLGSPASAYAASKAGLVGLTRSLVLNYAQFGVRVNAICPGAILTDMSRDVRASPELTKRLIEGVRPAESPSRRTWRTSSCSWPRRPRVPTSTGAILPLEGGLVLN